MQIEHHQLPDGGESVIKRVFAETDRQTLRDVLRRSYRTAAKKETLTEIRQVEFDPEDVCPCGTGNKKAKNCCAGRLLRRLAQEKAEKAK
jgi:uncharacterized protein YecA (UPF0149 family)